MASPSRVPKDRRSSARVVELLNCRFNHGDSTHNAVIVNISHNGALLSSRFQVPTGNTIDITFQSEHINKTIKMIGKVTRCTRVTTDHGIKYRVVVEFSHTPLDLLKLLARLKARY